MVATEPNCDMQYTGVSVLIPDMDYIDTLLERYAQAVEECVLMDDSTDPARQDAIVAIMFMRRDAILHEFQALVVPITRAYPTI